MKIIVAFDSFKGCMSASDACAAAAGALRKQHPDAEVVELPLSDGGEGLVCCVSRLIDVQLVTIWAHDPLMRPIEATYALSRDGQTAYIEMAATSGLTLVAPAERDVMRATTYGVGEMLLDAARRGVSEVVMGIGGSATCDGGQGMVECLHDQGWQPGDPLPQITVASDVSNPLCGEQGAARVFGPQKGASPTQVMLLDERLGQWARQTEAAGLATPETALSPGAGAAGGLGYGLMAYVGARLLSGIDVLLDIGRFDQLVSDADLIITGEGKSDSQTLMGKVPHGVLRRCRAHAASAQVWLLSGAIDDPAGALKASFDRVSGINEGDNRPLSTLMQREVAIENLQKTLNRL